MKKQLKAAKNIAYLKVALKEASPEERASLKRRLVAAKKVFKWAAKRVAATKPKPIGKRISALRAKLAKAKNPVRRAALKKALKLAKKVAALKKKLRDALPAERKVLKAKLLKVRKALVKAASKAKKAPKHISVKIAAIEKALKNAVSRVRKAALRK